MDLLQQIKSERAQKKIKRPFKRTLFDKVNGLVRRYSLDESYLARLEVPEDYLIEANIEFSQLRKKSSMEFPLFSLSAEKEYRLTTAIMSKVDNPYLEFAQSPDEIALSKPLFDLNPSLGAEQLERFHFETLLLCERAKKEMKDLLRQAKDRRKKKGTGLKEEFLGDAGTLSGSLEKKIEQLKSFIASVEDSQTQ